MFFLFSKILQVVLNPFYWILGVLLWACFSPHNRRRTLLIIGLSLLYIYNTDFLLHYLYKQWEYPMVWYKDVPDGCDAAIVLGGMAAPGKLPDDRTHFAGSPDRLLHALQLYKLGKVRKIILTGGSGELVGQKIPEAEYLKKVLLIGGVKEEDILLEAKSRNTRENALFTKELIKNEFAGEPKFILVTSAWHMARAVGCFEKVGLKTNPFPVSSEVSTNSNFFGRFLPCSFSPTKWNALFHEYFGYCSYKMMGYI